MMHCTSARHRLQVGVPATVEHRVERSGKRTTAVSVAECVHHYIGAMDTLKLNMVLLFLATLPHLKHMCCAKLTELSRISTFFYKERPNLWPCTKFAKDQLAPCLSDLLLSIYKVPQLPAEFIGKTSLQIWRDRLERMRASDELNADESRQLLYDIELSYNQFMQLLGGNDIFGQEPS